MIMSGLSRLECWISLVYNTGNAEQFKPAPQKKNLDFLVLDSIEQNLRIKTSVEFWSCGAAPCSQ